MPIPAFEQRRSAGCDRRAHRQRRRADLRLSVRRATQFEEVLPLRGRHDHGVPQERLEQPIQFLLVHVQVEQRTSMYDRGISGRKPNAPRLLRFLVAGSTSLADMPALLRPHSSGIAGSFWTRSISFAVGTARELAEFREKLRCVLNSARTKRGKRYLERNKPDPGRADASPAIRAHCRPLGPSRKPSRDNARTPARRCRPSLPARPPPVCPSRRRSRSGRRDSRAARRIPPPAR